MVKHIILWQLKDSISAEEKINVKKNIKTALESLKGVVPGLTGINVQIESLESSNADLMLDSTFESFDALKAYAIHPAHVAAADTAVCPFTQPRLCLDFEI